VLARGSGRARWRYEFKRCRRAGRRRDRHRRQKRSKHDVHDLYSSLRIHTTRKLLHNTPTQQMECDMFIHTSCVRARRPLHSHARHTNTYERNREHVQFRIAPHAPRPTSTLHAPAPRFHGPEKSRPPRHRTPYPFSRLFSWAMTVNKRRFPFLWANSRCQMWGGMQLTQLLTGGSPDYQLLRHVARSLRRARSRVRSHWRGAHAAGAPSPRPDGRQ
jgi:hypothetical protein